MKFPKIQKIGLRILWGTFGIIALSMVFRTVTEQHFLFEALLWVAAGVVFWQYRKWHKNKRRDKFGETIRGSQIEDRTKQKGKPTDNIEIGGVPIPREYEPGSLLLIGAPGQGKTVAIENMLDTVRARGQRCVIYDSTGEFVQHYYREGQDVILSPIDQRSPIWIPWAEGVSAYAYENIAGALIPTGSGNEAFWTQAAKAVFRSCLAEVKTIDELIDLVFRVDGETLAAVMESQGLAGLIGPAQMFASSRGTAATYLQPLAYLPRPTSDKPVFSIREWVRNESVDSWLFISSRADCHVAIKPLLSMWLGIAIQASMSLSPDRNRRLWMVLDELPTLQKLDSLDGLLAGGRKYGLAAILGIQSIGQVRDPYGRDAASALLSHSSTRLILKVGDSETADYLSQSIGERHSLRDVKSESDNSASTAEQHTIERAVLPSEIMSLPRLTGYLRVPDKEAIQKVKLQFRDRDQIAPAYTERSLDTPPPIPKAAAGDMQIPQALLDKYNAQQGPGH